MKKQKVSLKKLHLAKSKVSTLNTNNINGGGSIIFLTDNGCGPKKSVWPDICPISDNCPPQSHTCPTANCESFDCQTLAGCPTDYPTIACW